MEHIEEIIKATPLLQKHLLDRYQKRLEWIRIIITILTPSLALLVGLQDKPLTSEKLQNTLLLISILLMTLSILTGLWLLFCESEAHGKAVDDIKEWVEAGNRIDDLPFSMNFPWHQNITIRFFPIFVWLSILFLGSFGMCKYL